VNNRMWILTIAALLCVSLTANAQSQKIGYVNSAKIFQELPAAQDAQKKIEAIGKPYRDTLEAIQTELQTRYDEYQKKEGLMTDAAKKAEQQKLMEMQNRLQQYRLEKFGNDGELAQRTEQILNPIRERIKTAIGAVAKEEKYGFVFDKTEQIQILLYGDPTADITFKVIDRLKRGK
jgi:outer membrane protein